MTLVPRNADVDPSELLSTFEYAQNDQLLAPMTGQRRFGAQMMSRPERMFRALLKFGGNLDSFDNYTAYLFGVLEADSLRNMALRFLFSEISEDYILGIAGYRIALPDKLVLDFAAGVNESDHEQPDNLWGPGALAACVRRGVPIEELKGARRLTFIPLIRRDVPLGAIVFVGEAEVPLPKEFSWMIASLSVAGGRILSGESEGQRRGGKPAGTVRNSLTQRQGIILRLVSQGLTNDQIARNLHVSNSTVRHETMKIYRQLGVADRISASTQARELGLIEDEADTPNPSGRSEEFLRRDFQS